MTDVRWEQSGYQIPVETVLRASLVLVYVVDEYRNAWQWTQSGRTWACPTREKAERAVNANRVQGSSFTMAETPAVAVEGDKGTFLIAIDSPPTGFERLRNYRPFAGMDSLSIPIPDSLSGIATTIQQARTNIVLSAGIDLPMFRRPAAVFFKKGIYVWAGDSQIVWGQEEFTWDTSAAELLVGLLTAK